MTGLCCIRRQVRQHYRYLRFKPMGRQGSCTTWYAVRPLFSLSPLTPAGKNVIFYVIDTWFPSPLMGVD
nr:MAG TPA: hypothetical protein [Caudoviricetes sp.]